MTDEAWFAPALEVLSAASGRRSERLGWLMFRGHRAQVFVPCDELGPLGVIRRWQSNDVASRERDVLEALAYEEPASIATTLPRHLGTYVHAGVVISMQSWLPGDPLRRRLFYTPATDVARVLTAVADWFVSRFERRELGQALPNYLTDTIAARLRRRTSGQPGQLAFERFVAASNPAQAECGVLHNDLHPGNLLFGDAGSISGVLDWEHAGRGPLICDWFGFVSEYALWLSRERRGAPAVERALATAWGGSSKFSRIAREQCERVLASSRTRGEGLLLSWRLAAFRLRTRAIRTRELQLNACWRGSSSATCRSTSVEPLVPRDQLLSHASTDRRGRQLRRIVGQDLAAVASGHAAQPLVQHA
jgi:Ser/Thr protein kinase RdoA (MazF antagonist)